MFNLVAQAYGWSLGMCHGLCPSLPHHLRRSTLGAAEVKQPRHIKFLRPQPKHLKFMAFSVKPKLSFHWLLESAAQNLRAALEKWWQGSIFAGSPAIKRQFLLWGPEFTRSQLQGWA